MQTQPGVITPETWRARVFQEEDRPSLLRLSASHFGEKEPGTPAYFDWLHQGGPAGRSLIPVCEDLATGEIKGFSFHVPFHVKIGEREAICHLGCNALVHPDYRRQGIYAAFNDLALASLGGSQFIYGFPKPRAVVAHEKVGKFRVSGIPLLVRPLDIGQLAEARFSNPALRLAVNAGWAVAGNTIWRPRRIQSIDGDLHISWEETFDPSFDQFWGRVSGKYEIMVKREAAFLNWRFRAPSFRTYILFTARVKGELFGYAVLRQTELEGVRTGLIMDLLVDKGTRGEAAGRALIAEAMRCFQESQMALVGCLILPHTQEYQILRQAGFVETPVRLSPQAFNLMTIGLTPETPNQYLARPERWFMTMANHDAV